MTWSRMKAFLTDTRASAAIEYGLIVALLVIAVISAITAIGGSSGMHFDEVQNGFNEAET